MFYDAAVDLSIRSAAVCESAIVFGQFMDTADVQIGCESIGLEAAGKGKGIFARLRELLARIGHALATFIKRLFGTQVYAGAADEVGRIFSKQIKAVSSITEMVPQLARNGSGADGLKRWLENNNLTSEAIEEAKADAENAIAKIKSSGGATHNIKSMKEYKSIVETIKATVAKLDSQLDVKENAQQLPDGSTERIEGGMTNLYNLAISALNMLSSTIMSCLQKCIYTTKKQDTTTYKDSKRNQKAGIAGRNKADVYQEKKFNKFMG